MLELYIEFYEFSPHHLLSKWRGEELKMGHVHDKQSYSFHLYSPLCDVLFLWVVNRTALNFIAKNKKSICLRLGIKRENERRMNCRPINDLTSVISACVDLSGDVLTPVGAI